MQSFASQLKQELGLEGSTRAVVHVLVARHPSESPQCPLSHQVLGPGSVFLQCSSKGICFAMEQTQGQILRPPLPAVQPQASWSASLSLRVVCKARIRMAALHS